jgi:uncharacterized protein (TIGR02646 family)
VEFIESRDYGQTPIARRHAPVATFGSDGYRKYRPCLRLDFEFRCAYCLSHEAEVAPGASFGGFEIDHFKPAHRREFRSLRNRYSNLFWTCHACNRAKKGTWPSDAEQQAGYRFLDPCADALGKHLSLNGDAVVRREASDLAATYTIEQINLNSALQRSRRSRRRTVLTRVATLQANAEMFRHEIGQLDLNESERAGLAARIEELELQSRQLLAALGDGPWDPPDRCYCAL